MYGPGATSHSIAAHFAATITADMSSPQATSSAVSDCRIGGDAASVFGFADTRLAGYDLFVIHRDRLFEIYFVGADGVSDQAVQDTLGMMGSITWST
jgi:hypothetical protein